MDIQIKELSQELIGDYINFFDDVAFKDHEEWSRCYCTFYHLDHEAEIALADSDRNDMRALATSYIKDGILKGYLAFADGKVVGWCNSNTKSGYKRLCSEKECWTEGEDEKIKSVVCFIIAPDMRRQGIASLLLDKACQAAKAEGYSYLEAYPANGDLDCFRHYHGHISMFEKHGFTVHRQFEDYCIVRKKMN